MHILLCKYHTRSDLRIEEWAERGCWWSHAPSSFFHTLARTVMHLFFIALFYYYERTVTRHFFIALSFLVGKWPDPKRYWFQARVSVPGPGSNPRSEGTDPSDLRRIQPQEFSDYQVVSLKKIVPFLQSILVDASLYIFGSHRVIKKQSTLTPMWDFLDYLVGTKQFF